MATPVISYLLVALMVVAAVAAAFCWQAATDRLSLEGRRRREAKAFMLELKHNMWYLEPSSYQDRGFAYFAASIVLAVVAFVAFAMLLQPR